jgi:uncharacterized protein
MAPHDPLLDKIQQNLIDHYKCHTIILYGSRARGDNTESSDYDILAIRAHGDLERDCRFMDGFYLDIFIYSEDIIQNIDPYLIRIKDGIVLKQKNNLGDVLLEKVRALFKSGSPKTPDWEKHEINQWIDKMLKRAKQEDVEGNFRRHWLLHDLLECYFKLRDLWYLGPTESFKWLKSNDPVVFDAFDRALKPHANFESIELLIHSVHFKM